MHGRHAAGRLPLERTVLLFVMGEHRTTGYGVAFDSLRARGDTPHVYVERYGPTGS